MLVIGGTSLFFPEEMQMGKRELSANKIELAGSPSEKKSTKVVSLLCSAAAEAMESFCEVDNKLLPFE